MARHLKMRWLSLSAVTIIASAMAINSASADNSPGADKPDWQQGLQAQIRLYSEQGKALEKPVSGEQFKIRVELRDPVTGQAPKGLPLEGWLRPQEASNLKCLEAARAFRATRRLPLGAVDLNGVLMVSLNLDGSYGIADPRLDLATANMIAAGSLPGLADAVSIDQADQSLLLLNRENATIHRLGADGRLRQLQAGKWRDPAHLISADAGRFWVSELQPGLLSLREYDGSLRTSHAIGPNIAGSFAGAQVVGVWTAQSIKLYERQEGTLLHAIDTDYVIGDVAASKLEDSRREGEQLFAVLDASGQRANLHYPDAPNDPVSVSLATVAQFLTFSPTSGLIYAWSRAGGISIIDPARSQVVSAVSVAAGIREIEFAGTGVFIMNADGSGVAVLDEETIAQGEAAQLREVRIGPRGKPLAENLDLLVSLEPSSQVLAVHHDSYTGFVIDARSAMGDAPPMTAVRLRGGKPGIVRVIDRSLRETKPGIFETLATMPSAGDHELVLTTGIGGMSTCLPITVVGERRRQASAPKYRLKIVSKAAMSAGKSQAVILSLRNEQNEAVALPAASVRVASLSHGWRTQTEATLLTDKTLQAQLTFPLAGLYSVQLTDPRAGGRAIANHVVEIER